MMISSNPGRLPPIHPLSARTADLDAGTKSQRTQASYDRFSSSEPHTDGSRFQLELVSRLAQETRAATTTGDVQELRRQVDGGTYQPDADGIAARMLLLEVGNG